MGGGEMSGAVVGFEVQGKGNNGPSTFRRMQTMSLAWLRHGPCMALALLATWRFWPLRAPSHLWWAGFGGDRA